MSFDEERYVMTISEAGSVRLRDQQTGQARTFNGAAALFDALGVLAEWRERPPTPTPRVWTLAVKRAYQNGARDEAALREMGF